MKKPTHIAYMVTTVCNLGCLHCYLKKIFEAKVVEFLSYDTYLHSLRAGLSIYDDSLHTVSFTGGEPLLHPQLEKFIRDAIKLDLGVCVYSNGLLHRKILRLHNKFKENLKWFISAHNLNALKRLKKIKPSIMIYPDVQKLEQLRKILSFVAEYPYREIIVLYPLAFPGLQVEKVSFKEWEKVIEEIKTFMERFKLENVYIENFTFRKNVKFECLSWKDIFIGPDGKQYPCCIAFGWYKGVYTLENQKIENVKECIILKHVWGKDYRKADFPFLVCPLSLVKLTNNKVEGVFPGEIS